MLDKSKTDFELGKKIHEHLLEMSVETPMKFLLTLESDDERRINAIRDHFKEIMNILGLDLSDDSLMETPKRIAKMFINEIFWGLHYSNFPKITTVENKMKYDEMIIEKDIKVMSNCEHHFVPIMGKCHIAYIPNKKVMGLSKLNRVVEFFSRRPQIQERLTEQIYYALSYILETEDISVIINANHMCVQTRGVEDVNSSTITSKMGGLFIEDAQARQEILSLVRK